MQRVLKSVAIALVLLLGGAMTGCSSFSKSGRQQRAYEKYIRKSSVAREKQRSRFRSDMPQMPSQPMPSEPMESTSSGPEAAPSEDSGE